MQQLAHNYGKNIHIFREILYNFERMFRIFIFIFCNLNSLSLMQSSPFLENQFHCSLCNITLPLDQALYEQRDLHFLTIR